VFALLDAHGFDAVDERQQLTLEPDQLRAGEAELPVGVGEASHVLEPVGRRSDVLRSALAAVGEDGAGVEFSAGTTAVRLSTEAAESVEGAGQEGLAAEKGLQKRLELLVDVTELRAKGTEVVWHGPGSREKGSDICILLYIYTYRNQGRAEKNAAAGKKAKLATVRRENLTSSTRRRRERSRGLKSGEAGFPRRGLSAGLARRPRRPPRAARLRLNHSFNGGQGPKFGAGLQTPSPLDRTSPGWP